MSRSKKSWFDRFKNSRRAHEIFAVILMVVAIAAILSIFSYEATDTTWFGQSEHTPDRQIDNRIGVVGAHFAEALLQLFGVGAFVLPFIALVFGWRLFRSGHTPMEWPRVVTVAILYLSLASLCDLVFGSIAYGGETFPSSGGLLGGMISSTLQSLVARTGALLVSISLVLVTLILTTGLSISRWVDAFQHYGKQFIAWVLDSWSRQKSAATPARAAARGKGVTAVGKPAKPTPARKASSDAPADEEVVEKAASRPVAAPTFSRERPTPKPPAPIAADKKDTKAKDESPRQGSLPLKDGGEKSYSLPPLELLNEGREQDRESEDALIARAKLIAEKFGEFSINGEVVAIHPGPVVTTFEFQPEAGVKYSRITGMTDDLSLALKAESVRIDRLPGRSTVGIEVPNLHQETIFPRELMASDTFQNASSKLTLALGKDIHGDVYCAELDRMPHLLIAGATGAGKSVGLNGMIVSMLYKATPRDLRFIMIDTKMIELGVYAGIPHLLIPVVTDPKHASTALQWAVREMEKRYRKLASVGMRNLAQFNKLLEEEPDRTMNDPKTGEEIPLKHLPYIVIVIDEMADLMMIASNDVEESVMRLAQMARAVGIHLILATQRPSVDVITGTIKANFPSRIAFRVSQRVDSRTIIDQQGAEHLLGRGDMLLLPTGSSRVVRMHSGYISEPEIQRITSFLKKMAEPQYDESVLEQPKEARGGVDGGERDEMFIDAVRTVINEGKCSITLIQRRLQLGYARAARIVDMMEQEGVVTPGEGSKPREVLVNADYIEQLEA